MNINTKHLLKRLSFALGLWILSPVAAFAAEAPFGIETTITEQQGGASVAVLLFSIGILITIFLVRTWIGILNVSTVYNTESLASVERKHPYIPDVSVIVGTIIVTAALVILSADTFARVLPLNLLFGSSNIIHRIITVVLAVAALGVFDRSRFHARRENHPYIFACILGTVVTWILIGFSFAFFQTGVQQDPFLMALGITCVITSWRFLFGPWSARIKVTILATFIFWVMYTILQNKSRDELIAVGLAALVACIPVFIWCKFFLSYHKQRLSYVALAFLSGILSVVPILFYDALARRSIEFDFFLFKIVPQHFGMSARTFVGGTFGGISGVQSTILITLVTFLIVGIIEEVSKFWMLKHSSGNFFRSISDVLQISIMIALGFAFAENLMNPNYFVGFVTDYLIRPPSPQWGPFIGNVFGRSVLTNMVHIVSAAVLAYFFAIGFFASPLLAEEYARGKRHPIVGWFHSVLAIKPEKIFEREMILKGFAASVGLHAVFDFIVSLPAILPGNPTTVGALMGMPENVVLGNISLILFPAIFYVFGGCWLLVFLLMRDQDKKMYGQKVETQTFVTTPEGV